MTALPLIAPKHISEFTAAEYHEYVTAMYYTEKKKESAAPGLTVRRTDKGILSIIRRSKQRFFAYVTRAEIEALSGEVQCSVADLWNVFKAKGYIIAGDRLAAEAAYSTTAKQQR